jgi:hypothetical protein
MIITNISIINTITITNTINNNNHYYHQRQCGPNSGPQCPDCKGFEDYYRTQVGNRDLQDLSSMELRFLTYDKGLSSKAKSIFHREGLIALLNEKPLEPVVSVSNHSLRLTILDSGSWYCDGKKLAGGCSTGPQIDGKYLDKSFNRYHCDECNFDYCETCMLKYKSDSVITDTLETVYLKSKSASVKVRKVPTFESSDCGLAVVNKSYKFDRVVDNWAKISPCEYGRLQACKDTDSNTGQILFHEHNPHEDGWCPIIKEGDVLFEPALLNKLGLPMYRGNSNYYCGRKLGREYVGQDTDGLVIIITIIIIIMIIIITIIIDNVDLTLDLHVLIV